MTAGRRPGLPGPHVLREYAFLGDGRRGALVGPRGDIGFLCVPDWHSPAVFAALLGGRGHYTVTPTDSHHVWGGYYEPGTLIWTSRWVTRDTIIHCREALSYPGDDHRAVLLRRIEAVDGEAVVDVCLDVRCDFGREPGRDLHRDGDVWTARSGALRWRWTGAREARPDRDGQLRMRLRLRPGDQHDLVLEIADTELGRAPEGAAAWRATEAAWRAGTPELHCAGARDAVHAVSVLRGLTHPDDGMAAAATMSLPERAEAGRNYDYRYAWIRDQCLAGQAAAAAGVPDLLDSAVRFVTDRLLADGPGLRPAYTIAPVGPIPDEQRLDFLPGYPGGAPITGNRATHQFQLDCFGEALLLLAAADRADRLDRDAAKAMVVAADVIADRWTEPDAGIWELDDQLWTHSRLICVAGLQAAARTQPRTTRWTSLADTILADADRHHRHTSGRWQRGRVDTRLDAALLLPIIRGVVPADDPRAVETVAAVHRELRRDGYVYRYQPDDRPLGEAEGSFLLCGFALANATHRGGDRVTAGRLFERARAACGPAGLYAEEYDITQRQLRGNIPQAFVHAMMLETAVLL